MIMRFRKIGLLICILTAMVVLSSNAAYAGLDLPWFSYTGSWEYDSGDHSLTTYFNGLTSIRYKDGSFDSPVGNGYDVIRGGVITLGNDNGSGGGVIYNLVQNSVDDNLLFGPSVGSMTSISFSLSEGGTDYMRGSLYDHAAVTIDGIGTRLDPSIDEDNVHIYWTNPAVSSDFLDDVNTFGTPPYIAWGNLSLQFTCSYGDCENNNFNDLDPDMITGGSFSGGKFTVVPEPVSSSFFLIGGLALVFRRYIRNRVN